MNENSIAFGAPGIEPRWTSSAKDAIGTAYHSSSCVWFTLSHEMRSPSIRFEGRVQTDYSVGVVRYNPEINKQVSSMTALRRPGVLDGLEPKIDALLSGENRWVNAQRIEVSGGLTL